MPEPLAPYPSPEVREQELHYLAGLLLAEVVPYGHSVEGRPLHAVRLPSPAPRTVFICANIHGVEFIGNRVAHGLLRALHSDPAVAALRQQAEIWVAPCLNPDGYARTWALDGDAPLALLRKNSRGVDLNRNFPMPWGARPRRVPFAGEDSPAAATHRGVAPASEPEVRHLLDLLQRVQPHAGLSLHSFMGTLIPPRVRHLADHRAYASLARAFRQGQREAGGTPYLRLAFPPLDVFTGEQEDHQHHVLRCWATCVETFSVAASLRQGGRTTFWRFNPRDPAPWVRQDVAGMVRWLAGALALERPPARPGAAETRAAW